MLFSSPLESLFLFTITIRITIVAVTITHDIIIIKAKRRGLAFIKDNN